MLANYFCDMIFCGDFHGAISLFKVNFFFWGRFWFGLWVVGFVPDCEVWVGGGLRVDFLMGLDGYC
jgi:hypothetical protein